MDIDISLGPTHFCVRVAGVFVHQGHVLLHNSDADDLWCLPGGRVRTMETTEQALRREMAEEVSTEVSVGQLQWVVENFFQYADRRWHEIGMYHLAEFTDPAWYDVTRTYRGLEGSLGLTYRWIPITQVGELNVVPRFLVQALPELPCGTRHIINRDL